MRNKHIDHNKRRTLKAFASLTIAGTAATSAVAGVLPDTTESVVVNIDCKLIYRDDSSRTYLLLHNKTDHDITIDKFAAQTIRFQNQSMNMAEALTKPVTVKSQDRILVHVNQLNNGYKHSNTNIIDLHTDNSLPTVGTRYNEIPVRVYQSVGIIDHTAVLPA